MIVCHPEIIMFAVPSDAAVDCFLDGTCRRARRLSLRLGHDAQGCDSDGEVCLVTNAPGCAQL